MRRALLVLLTICLAVCAAQTHFPAPIFDEGENLSSQNCGNESTLNQWIAYVKNISTEQYCGPFVAISQRTLLGLGICAFKRSDTTDLRVFPNNCISRETEEECIRYSVRVLDVIDIAINPTADLKFKILVTERMPSVVAPICLFNRDNVINSQRQRETYSYVEWTTFWDFPSDPKHVTDQSNCNTVLNSTELENLKTKQIPIQNMLCVGEIPYGYMINFYKGRYFLRGVKYARGVYIDILPYIGEIARHARDISVLRPIPQTKQPRGFNAPDNLSFPNCGRKPTSTRRKRENDDSSEDIQPIGHIFGGNKAHETHPWHAYIENEETGAACGGTLISPTVVLTVAHCIYESEAKDFTVVVGMYDKRKRRSPGLQTRKISSLITHPKYDPAEFNSNVGIMILNEKIEITNQVRPICLWNDDSDSNLVRVAGTEAMAVGFGLVDNHTRTEELQEARLLIRGHKECYLSSRRFFAKYLVPGDNFCAGYTNGTTVCNGDSGGSLSVEKDGRWFIRGILSFGVSKKVMFEGEQRSLCHPNHYSLIVDVASYMDWIVENTPEISFRN
ncbi:transmembrane protease serine 9-like [Cloeon dipterum]|uniref:transmembrane protease serine 9-like n=1 Tax=Cloeon dipterum TaxID=197152 RepID=UPI0032202722